MTKDSYAAFQESEIPDALLPKIIFDETWSPGVGRFMQYRLLVKHPCGFGHITVGFDSNREITKTIREINDDCTRYAGKTRSAHFVTLSAPEPEAGKKKIGGATFIMVNDMTDVHENNSAHVTVNPGPHAPVCMKAATIAVRGDEDTVSLSVKAKPPVVYTLADAEMNDIEVTLVTAFGI